MYPNYLYENKDGLPHINDIPMRCVYIEGQMDH